jgi:type II secretory pathway pseudopilin PulG
VRLLEILVVIALIGLVGGAVGIRLHHSHSEAQFQEAVKGIASKIDLAQELQLALEADVTIHLTPHKKGLQVQLEIDCELPESLKQLTHPTYFSGITSWEPDEIRLPSAQTLRLDETELKLRGYPAPLLDS